MMRMSVRPACTASSTTYWIAGRSTTGSISLGMLLVAGRKRVPIPAAVITALRTGCIGAPSATPMRGRLSGGRRAEVDLLASQQPSNITEMTNDHQHCERGDGDNLPYVVTPPHRTQRGNRDREQDRREQRRQRCLVQQPRDD